MSDSNPSSDQTQQHILVHEIVLINNDSADEDGDESMQENSAAVAAFRAEGGSSSGSGLNQIDLMSKAYENNALVVGNGKFTDYSWDAISTLKLLAYRKELSPLIASRSITRKHVFMKIADLLGSLEHRSVAPTPEQCDNKWKWLKRKYCAVKDKLKENPMENPQNIKFQYYKEMDEIMEIENKPLQIQITKLPSSATASIKMPMKPRPKPRHKHKHITYPNNEDNAIDSADVSESEEEADFVWNRRTTTTFLEVKKELDDLKLPKDKLFDKLAGLMDVYLPRNQDRPSAEQCESKWRWLNKRYNFYRHYQSGVDKFPYWDKMNEMMLDSPNTSPRMDSEHEEDSSYMDYVLLNSRARENKFKSRKRKRENEDLGRIYECVNEANRDQKDRQFGHMVELMQSKTAAVERQTDVLIQILEHLRESGGK